MISRDDVPAADSDAVTQSLPPTQPRTEESMDTEPSNTVHVNGQSITNNVSNSTNHVSSNNQSKTESELKDNDFDPQDSLFCRKYVDNIHADPKVQSNLRFRYV